MNVYELINACQMIQEDERCEHCPLAYHCIQDVSVYEMVDMVDYANTIPLDYGGSIDAREVNW